MCLLGVLGVLCIVHLECGFGVFVNFVGIFCLCSVVWAWVRTLGVWLWGLG